MRPRAAIFCLHDVVPPERLADVPVTHRPYALTPDELRALLVEACASRRRALPVGLVPTELAGGFYGLTFDDGAASDYHVVFPILRELGLRATFFVVPTLVDTPGHVGWAELREMVAAGMEIGSHSLTHPFVNALGREELVREFGESKRILEERLGIAVRSASLPRGWEPPALRTVLTDLGYRTFCTSRVGWWYPGQDALSIPRIAIRRGLLVEEFASILNGERRALWRMQAVEAAKNAAKACLGQNGWQRLRAPLLAFRERV
jgi:peptidoglycan/xylan/chitin deacetylase (PgdA/CDA1 family)